MSAFPISDCRDCHVGATVAVHAAEIDHLKATTGRIEGKIDKLIWATIGGLGAVTLALFMFALKAKG